MNSAASLLRTLGLTEDQLQRLLDGRCGPPDEAAKRRCPRSPYRCSVGVVIEFLDRENPQGCSRVAPYDISACGIGFLHRGPIPAGTPLTVDLSASTPAANSLPGRVIRCLRLYEEICDVGVAFDQPMDFELILRESRGERSRM